jgi:hypothetical protein
MAFKHGKSVKVFCDSYELSSYFNSATITQNGEPNETTTFTKDSKTFIKGLTSGSLSLEGLFEASTDIDPTATTKTFDQFLNGLVAATNPSVITWVPYTMAAGSWVKGAYARLNSYDITSPVADVVSASTSWDTGHAGASSTLVYASSWAAESLTTGSAVTPASGATVDGTTVNSGASSANGYLAIWHIVANGSNATQEIKIQHSTNGSSWSDLATIEASVAAGALTSGIAGAASGTVNQYLRFQFSASGSYSSGTITPIISVGRISATQA